MAWTAPRTWVTGEVVTAALLNTHMRDNLNFLKTVGGLTKLTQVAATADLSLSTTPTDVTGATTSHTTTIANATVVAIGVFEFAVATSSAGVLLKGHINIDAANVVPEATAEDDNANLRGTFPAVYVGTLATAASHTIKLQGSKGAALGTSIIEGDQGRTTLTVAIFE